jgi:hypothetical protein
MSGKRNQRVLSEQRNKRSQDRREAHRRGTDTIVTIAKYLAVVIAGLTVIVVTARHSLF